jgi:hypothetical protein
VELGVSIFWLLVFGILWLLRRNPESIASHIAFSWIGPLPNDGESWVKFQLRWASYSFNWLVQFSVVLSVFFIAVAYFPAIQEELWFKVPVFALPLGAAMALLATIGFLVKAAKARWYGPNPKFREGGFGEDAA